MGAHAVTPPERRQHSAGYLFGLGLIVGILAPALLLGCQFVFLGIQRPPSHSHVDFSGFYYVLLWAAGALMSIMGFGIWQFRHTRRPVHAFIGGLGFGAGCIVNLVGVGVILDDAPTMSLSDLLIRLAMATSICAVLSGIVTYAIHESLASIRDSVE